MLTLQLQKSIEEAKSAVEAEMTATRESDLKAFESEKASFAVKLQQKDEEFNRLLETIDELKGTAETQVIKTFKFTV